MKDLSEKHDARKPELYYGVYDEYFSGMRTEHLAILELGVFKGGSLRLWADYFPASTVIGIDLNNVELAQKPDRIHVYQGYQQDPHLLDRVRRERAPNGFDLVIDDASHIGSVTKTSFWHIFDRHLVPGGIYAIEDWGTGFWPKWSDGERFQGHEGAGSAGAKSNYFPSHQYGMVGFLKQLVDECHYDAIKDGLRAPANRPSKFERMCVFAGLALITKAGGK